MEDHSEEWVTMTKAVKILKEEKIKIGRNKISKLATKEVIKTKDNPLDERVKLVDLNELRALFKRYGANLQ